jgi:hypothetical protein
MGAGVAFIESVVTVLFEIGGMVGVGWFVAFSSRASDLVPGDTNNIALRANVRTVFKCCIYTFSYSFKLFKSLSHPCF